MDDNPLLHKAFLESLEFIKETIDESTDSVERTFLARSIANARDLYATTKKNEVK